MPPLVSVIIPYYMQPQFLADAIQSVLAQTYRRHEIIIINDGSPDTPALERLLAPFPSSIIYVRQENRGLSGARNAGLEVSTGELVVCLDSDDRLLPNALAAGVEAFAAQPACALVWGFHRLIDVNGNAIPYKSNVLEQTASYLELLKINIIGPPVGVMFRRAMLAEIGGFSTMLHHAEDYDVYLRLARRHQIHCHRTLIAEYRKHGANMSLNMPGMLQGVLQALDRQAPWVRDDPQLERAWRDGRDQARTAYDWELRLKRFHLERQARSWAGVSVSGALLLAKYPRKFSRLLGGRLKRSLRQLGS